MNNDVHHAGKYDDIIRVTQIGWSIIASDTKVRSHFNGLAHPVIYSNIEKARRSDTALNN